MPTRPARSTSGETASTARSAACPVSGIATRVRVVSTALYRRYRPETFTDVIGQEHVTEPLMQALRTGRVNHAYLFSGPRGCGKTTSARILARCLNCETGPTPEPCGTCDSCVALARGGSGTVDVIEIDAASHGGVDDARDLRERASYGPAQSRYKIYIIDEAHMVTPQGFNALLKIVEEPPEHVKFVFATTEPEKVIGTIRSRTHHYPFRLVPPARLQAYMEELCVKEGVAVAPGVLSFVVRAGGGSVRDSLSVLDQLIAGSGPTGSPTSRPRRCSASPTASCSTPPIDAFAARRRGRGLPRRSTRSSRPGSTPAASSRTSSSGCATSSSWRRCTDGAGSVLRHVPEDQLERMRPPGGRVRAGCALARRRRRQRRAHRDDRRHRAAAPARAHRRAHPAARCRRRGGVRRPPRPARAPPRRRWGAHGARCRMPRPRRPLRLRLPLRGGAGCAAQPTPPGAGAAPARPAAPSAARAGSARRGAPPPRRAPSRRPMTARPSTTPGASPRRRRHRHPRRRPAPPTGGRAAATACPSRPPPSRTPRGPAASTPTRCAGRGPTCSSG